MKKRCVAIFLFYILNHNLQTTHPSKFNIHGPEYMHFITTMHLRCVYRLHYIYIVYMYMVYMYLAIEFN